MILAAITRSPSALCSKEPASDPELRSPDHRLHCSLRNRPMILAAITRSPSALFSKEPAYDPSCDHQITICIVL
ncbi:hypothetical protein RRG08_021922 [Elysia crispata]|uniref:Uncharacterized protein n=1 Tax=Elysia crispata TaxID=231223 RepID=A0AAE1ACL1_9GAST|nr:hypothetical protein RRG08_021922 [Elysia crispata]